VRASPKKKLRKARSSAGSPVESPAERARIALKAPETLAALASELGGEVDPGAGDLEILRIAPVDVAGPGDLAPLVARRYLQAALRSEAALLVDPSLAPKIPAGRRWIHPHAAFTLALLLKRIEDARRAEPPGRRASRGGAHIDPEADVDPTAIVGPGAVILAGAAVGPGARIEPNAVIYGGAIIGARAVIGAGSVIGRPGFGWTPSPTGELVRVPQLGGVRIDPDAEIGPLCTVDAGTLADSWQQQPGAPCYCTDLTREEMPAAWAAADAARLPKRRDLAIAAVTERLGDSTTNPDAEYLVRLNRALYM